MRLFQVPLPPVPALDTCPILTLYDRARGAISHLDGVTTVLPSRPLFLFMYVRKEALLSSQIEGAQSSLSDLLLFENDEIPQIPINDVTEVSNCVAAIEHGMACTRGGFPLSLRLIRDDARSPLAERSPFLQRRPMVTIQSAAKTLKLSIPTIGKALDLVVSAGIVHEVTGKRRNRLFAYSKYLALLDKGTEPLPPA